MQQIEITYDVERPPAQVFASSPISPNYGGGAPSRACASSQRGRCG
jgi:hypothetical protein